MITATEITKHRIFYGYWILTVAFICQLLGSGTAGYSFSVYVQPLHAEFGWGRASTMLANTILSMIVGLSSPFVGHLLYRHKAKDIMALGALVQGLGLVLLSTMNELWQFYLFSAVLAVGSSAVGIVTTSMVVSNWFKKRRGWAIGILGMGIGVGGFLMPPLIGIFLIPSFGWRAAYLVSGLLVALIITPLAFQLIKATPGEMGLEPDGMDLPLMVDPDATGSPTHETGLTLRMATKTSAFWFMAVAFTTFGIGNSAIFQNQVPYLQDTGFPAATAAAVMGVVGIFSAMGKLGFGWLCDFIQAKYSLAIGIGLNATAVLILMNVQPASPRILLWLFAVMLGLAVGCWLPSMSMSVSTTFGMASYGMIFGVISMLFQSGGSFGPLIAGLIYDANRSYFWAFVLILTLYAIALLTILLVASPEKRARDCKLSGRRLP